MFTGCTNWEKIREDVAEKNKKTFEEMFQAKIDPAQDWNVVEQSSVSVTVNTPSDIKIYAYDGAYNSLVADYEGVSGTQKLTFDNLKGVKKVYVANMTERRAVIADLNGSADFSASKAAVDYSDENVTIETNPEWKYFTYRIFKKDLTIHKMENTHGPKDVSYIAFNDLTLNPVFWEDLGAGIDIGVYFDVYGERKEYKIYNRLEAAEDGFYQCLTNDFKTFEENTENNYPEHKYNNVSQADNNIRSKGIHVEMLDGTLFGFFVRIDNGPDQLPYVIYSNYNDNKAEWERIKNRQGKYATVSDAWMTRAKAIYADTKGNKGNTRGEGAITCTTITTEADRQYLRFECFNKNVDYRDLVFAIDSKNIIVADNEATAWTLAFEDMGTANDYDFNDVVLRVSHVAGQSKARVWVMAIGGTIENYLYLGDPKNHENLIGEVHELMGVPNNGQVVNAREMTVSPKEIAPVTVPANFTMSQVSMGGFVLSNNFGTSVVAKAEDGCVPYAICVPGTWQWPVERTRIDTAYPDFAQWVADHSKADTWYKNADHSHVVVR